MNNGEHGHAGHLPLNGRGMAISAWLTGVYFVIEMAIGLWTGSIAVISDAFHTFSAVGGVLVIILGKLPERTENRRPPIFVEPLVLLLVTKFSGPPDVIPKERTI